MAVRRFQRFPIPAGVDLSAPEGCVLERYEAEVVLDPAHPSNGGVAGLGDASTGADGGVAVILQAQLLAPADRDVSTLLVEVVNRGQAAHVPFDGDAVTAHRSAVFGAAPRALERNALVLRDRGAVLWCGWQWDLAGGDPRLLAAAVPAVRPDVHRRHPPVTANLTTPVPAAVLPLFGLPGAASPYPVEDLGDGRAELRAITAGDGAGALVPRDRWGFTREPGDPDGVNVWCVDAFVPGTTYRVTYRGGRCPVAGAAMLAVRDVVAFLRSRPHPVPSPLPAPPAVVLGYGMSQAGRFLRQFLHDDRNAGENGERVFDGLLVHAAGAWRDALNGLHPQPSSAPAPGSVPHGSSASGDLLARTAPAVRPRVLFTHTATEYWRGDAALTHLDAVTERDLPDPAHARHYLFAGLDHYGSRRPPGRSAKFPVNDVDSGLLLRAAYWALRRWVSEGVEPPPSAVPRFADGTVELRSVVLDEFRSVTGFGEAIALDDGWPPAWVSAVDAWHNERAGIRLPEVAVPLATLTGWNPRTTDEPGATTLTPLTGARLPLDAAHPDCSATAVDARRTEQRCREIAEDLAARGVLLAEDVDACVRRALRY
ncbi:alpha/beta hydrolase domain-containing protein [Actinomycetospora flava]|uniref:Alpha/beta hydrolase domain-containing protein n=1 Tax=Actinomycetospora flava TaxID=3129232 RepID=A0ABU8M495_9PSEU